METTTQNKCSMRRSWFDHVSKVRKKLSKGKNVCTHRQAMAAASETWPSVKEKLMKKKAREDRKAAKLAAKGM